MLKITIPAIEQWDEINEMFVSTKEQVLQLEHSLVSVSKWESKWQKSFFSKQKKTIEETLDYIRCMTINSNVDKDAYQYLTNKHIDEINAYIESPMTATRINEKGGNGGGEMVTTELIYYWMIAFNIPFECQKWHLNRLLTLIKVCNIKNQPPKKMSRSEIMNRNASLNAARKKQLNTRG